MNVPSFIYLLGSAPAFASRAFLAAFFTALLARFGTNLPFVSDNEVIVALAAAPAWFKSDTTLLVLGLLAVLESFSAKVPEIRAFLDEVDAWVKSAVSLIVSLSLVDRDTAGILKAVDQQSLVSAGTLVGLAVSGAVWVLSHWRKDLLGVLYEMDDDDHIGLQSIVSWVESVGTFLLLLFLVILPSVAILLSALVSLGVHLARKRAERRERESRVPCVACGVSIHACATRCSSCGTEVATPRKVGVFGQPKAAPALELERHRFELVARKRCPACAKYLKARSPRQACEECGEWTFPDAQAAERYLERLGLRLPRTLFFALLLSSIPILGIIPGVIYFRVALISGVRGYIPPLKGCLTRWFARLINWGIIAFQWIPIVGAVVLPLMCWSNFAIYRRAMRQSLRSTRWT